MGFATPYPLTYPLIPSPYPLLFSPRDGLEVLIHLPLVLRRRFVIRAGRQTILRALRLQLLRQRRLDVLERLRRLAAQLFPFREILLEGFGPRRGDRLARGFFERKPAAPAACQRRIVAPDLIDQILRLPHLAHVLFARLRRVGRTGAAGGAGR